MHRYILYIKIMVNTFFDLLDFNIKLHKKFIKKNKKDDIILEETISYYINIVIR